MFGTSYSGFNSLQIACERPPELEAIFAIFATDDRWTDDVHWRGGALRLVDLVDYYHYMTPMCVLPPVPGGLGRRLGGRVAAPAGDQRAVGADLAAREHARRLLARRVGAARRRRAGYERIECPTMLVAGWADGYRNNSFRTVAALAANGVPHRLLAGPWAHADPRTAMPGPADRPRRRDGRLVRPLAARTAGRRRGAFDVPLRRLRPLLHPARARPRPARGLLGPPAVRRRRPGRTPSRSPATARCPWSPDTGTAAWIDCAGHLPWGLSDDQRLDDARSLTWDVEPPTGPLVGQPRARLRVSADAPAASLSVKLCDVFPDGTSALVSRGTLDLAFRDGVHGRRPPLVPGQEYDVVVDLDACAYEWAPGNRLRVSVAGSDWPNTVAPPAPVTITMHGGWLELPVLEGGRSRADVHRRRGALHRDHRRRRLGDPRRRAAPARPPAPTPSPTTTRRTTATRARTTAARSASTAVPSSSGARRDHPRPDLARHRVRRAR